MTGIDGDWDLEIGGSCKTLVVRSHPFNLQCSVVGVVDTDGDGICDIDDRR